MSLYLRNKIWWVHLVGPDGVSIRRSTKTTIKRDAQKIHNALKAELRGRNESVLNIRVHQPKKRVQPKSDIENATVQVAIDMWLAYATHKATFKRDERVLKWFSERIGSIPLNEIKGVHIYEALETRTDLKPSSINVYLAIIKAVLRKAHKVWEICDRAPNIVLVRNNQRRIRYITREEAKRLLSCLPQHQKDVVRFSLLTGLRKSNVLGLCWSQVDLERCTAWIHPDQSKSRRPIAVPLNDEAIRLLKDVKERALMLSSKKKLSFKDIIEAVGRFLEDNTTEPSEPILDKWNKFQGISSNAARKLPTIHFVPAVRDLSDEMKIKTTSLFGRIF